MHLHEATDLDLNAVFESEITPRDGQFTNRIINLGNLDGNDPVDPNAPAGPVEVEAYEAMGAYELCEGNVDGDGRIGLFDLAIPQMWFGTTQCRSATGPTAHMACCGTVEGDDYDVDLAAAHQYHSSKCPRGSEAMLRGGESSSHTKSDDPLIQWLRSATIDQILAWYHAGMPPIESAGDRPRAVAAAECRSQVFDAATRMNASRRRCARTESRP